MSDVIASSSPLPEAIHPPAISLREMHYAGRIVLILMGVRLAVKIARS